MIIVFRIKNTNEKLNLENELFVTILFQSPSTQANLFFQFLPWNTKRRLQQNGQFNRQIAVTFLFFRDFAAGWIQTSSKTFRLSHHRMQGVYSSPDSINSIVLLTE